MRIDHQTAIGELASAWESLAPHVDVDGPPFPAHVQVRLFDLATLLVEHPLVADAARAACAHPGWKHDAVLAETLAQVRPVARRGAMVGQRLDELISRLYTKDQSSPAIQEARTSVNRRDDWRGAQRTVGEILRDDLRDVSDLDLHYAGRLGGSVLLIARNAIHALRPLDEAACDALVADVHELQVDLNSIIDAHKSLATIARTAELAPTLAWLGRLHERMVELRGGIPGPLPLADDDPLRHVPVRPAIHNVARLVAATRFRLSSGVSRRHAIRRLTTFIERFDRVALRTRIEALPENAQPESCVQEAVDRFLFGEGLFPITHCTAGAGTIDTLFEVQDELVDEADRTAQPAILLELKQYVRRPPPSRAALLTVIKSALGQAEHYRTHVAARPGWRDHDVHVLIVYGGRQRYRTALDNVVLAYVGETPPSQGAVLVEPEGA